ncbi:betaine/proline/choline family ABC transporter ATP-binding protein [soil metagenome]
MKSSMIRLEQLTKRFPGQEQPAVHDLDLEIPEGEIVVFVGPSGCGKTTTMKMINRIIEPTSGKTFLEGEDVTQTDPDKLRRRIGYVIQQIGLFPHMTIYENVAAVPNLLKWDDAKTSTRVDELLDVVGLDPGAYRDRYPKELSGGQRQRVGVARALAADPPVMLMDEPFGAIDPITRDRLQNEFLRLQEEIRKTIVFVTHDIDEAIKMGDRIAIMGEQSRIAQFDTPEAILSAPADDFVADFIGSRASLKRLSLARVRDYELAEWPTAPVDTPRDQLIQRIRESDKSAVLILDDARRPLRWLHANDIRREDQPLTSVGQTVITVTPQATLADALNEMVRSWLSNVVVLDPDWAYRGTVDMSVISEAAEAMRQSAFAAARAEVDVREEAEVG